MDAVELELDEPVTVAMAHGLPEGTELPTKKIVPPALRDAVIDAHAEALLAGRAPQIKKDHRLQPVSLEDRRAIQRSMGMSVEEFNRKISDKLGALADAMIDRAFEKVAADQVKPDQLFFGISVCEDKRAKLDGRGTGTINQVNVQVNITTERTREDVMAELTGR